MAFKISKSADLPTKYSIMVEDQEFKTLEDLMNNGDAKLRLKCVGLVLDELPPKT